MKRLFDFSFSFFGLSFFLPLGVLVGLLIFLTDFHNPFYAGKRMGRFGKLFRMLKFRSMFVNADKSGVTSTSSNDQRITWIGSLIRRFKFDELPQLINVLLGQMSFVGPRPQVPQALSRYSESERKILELRPGITDFSSIIFSDEGEILKNEVDADEAYYRLIHPWKMKLSLFYLEHQSLFLDVFLIFCTLVCIPSRETALRMISRRLEALGAEPNLVECSLRKSSLEATQSMTANPI